MYLSVYLFVVFLSYSPATFMCNPLEFILLTALLCNAYNIIGTK